MYHWSGCRRTGPSNQSSSACVSARTSAARSPLRGGSKSSPICTRKRIARLSVRSTAIGTTRASVARASRAGPAGSRQGAPKNVTSTPGSPAPSGRSNSSPSAPPDRSARSAARGAVS